MQCYKLFIFILIAVCFCDGISAQTRTINGIITDSESGELLIGVVIHDQLSHRSTLTNEYGFYSLTLTKDSAELVIEYFGYTSQYPKVNLIHGHKYDFRLAPDIEGQKLEEVIVTNTSSIVKDQINSTQMGMISVNPKQIKLLPAIGGEVDVVKVLQLMPGVQKGNEGGSGMFVRGGTNDQNLILLDEATVYNPGHLFGFFSIFNNDALKDVQIIKGGFPASYGGRLSSVLDIKSNEGNNQSYKVEGGVGMLSSRLTVQGPIIKDKMSFIVSGRRTYLDKFLKLLRSSLLFL